MATNEARSEKEGEFPSPGEGTLGFDDNTLQAIAEVYKNEGNDAFKREEFRNAVAFYSEGIKVNCRDEELNAKLYHNRSMAHFYSGNYQESLDDAKAATELQSTYIKAIARGASACVKLLLYKEAITWCDKGLAVSTVDTL